MTNKQKDQIRQQWCDQLCEYFNIYFKTGRKSQIRTPLYTAQVLSTFGILDFNSIDFKEKKVNLGQNSSRTNNENLIYESFDKLIEQKVFIGDLMIEFRHYWKDEKMPF